MNTKKPAGVVSANGPDSAPARNGDTQIMPENTAPAKPTHTSHDARLDDAVEALLIGRTCVMAEMSETTRHGNGDRHTVTHLRPVVDRFDVRYDDGTSSRRWLIEDDDEIRSVDPVEKVNCVYDSAEHAIRSIVDWNEMECAWTPCEQPATYIATTGFWSTSAYCADHADKTTDGDAGTFVTLIKVVRGREIEITRTRLVKWEGEASE